MLVKLSSKGQLVIPKDIRTKLRLTSETRFHMHTTAEGTIILEPVHLTTLEALYGKYAHIDLITDLEAEHHAEVENENNLRS
jgi:AbrB family looped-hinge helix DNA binding protein